MKLTMALFRREVPNEFSTHCCSSQQLLLSCFQLVCPVTFTVKPKSTTLIQNKGDSIGCERGHLSVSPRTTYVVCSSSFSVLTTVSHSHVMITSKPREPGEINDPSGIGNDDFDKGLKESKFGYPVLGVY